MFMQISFMTNSSVCYLAKSYSFKFSWCFEIVPLTTLHSGKVKAEDDYMICQRGHDYLLGC